ncbi:hypothetical protein [Pseudarthrobacter polychromogenes]|nr:hypothetical protein [Pseudarthrobacter polychromogenes]
MTWMEWPINGDMIARQRAGILGPSLLFSWADPEEIDWEAVESEARPGVWISVPDREG